MSFAVVIPARFGSTRLPGKPLLDIAGKTMIQRVWEQALASGAGEIIVATDDSRIEAAARDFGAQVCMTNPAHPSGTDRLQEVASQCGWDDDRVVVNVQGDEPLIPPSLIEQVAVNLEANAAASIATLCEPITELAELINPNAVKVVMDRDGKALYFSRASIPWPREAFSEKATVMPQGDWFRHIGIYAYRVGFLHRYVTWPVAPIEAQEQLEQLRALYNGECIHVAPASVPVPAGVDTAEDLESVRIAVAQQK